MVTKNNIEFFQFFWRTKEHWKTSCMVSYKTVQGQKGVQKDKRNQRPTKLIRGCLAPSDLNYSMFFCNSMFVWENYFELALVWTFNMRHSIHLAQNKTFFLCCATKLKLFQQNRSLKPFERPSQFKLWSFFLISI